MTLQQIVERLERIEQLWEPDSQSDRLAAIERLRLDIERHLLLAPAPPDRSV